jgi:hypothetical protein
MNAEPGPSTPQETSGSAMEGITLDTPGLATTADVPIASADDSDIKVFAPPVTAPITPAGM